MCSAKCSSFYASEWRTFLVMATFVATSTAVQQSHGSFLCRNSLRCDAAASQIFFCVVAWFPAVDPLKIVSTIDKLLLNQVAALLKVNNFEKVTFVQYFIENLFRLHYIHVQYRFKFFDKMGQEIRLSF